MLWLGFLVGCFHSAPLDASMNESMRFRCVCMCLWVTFRHVCSCLFSFWSYCSHSCSMTCTTFICLLATFFSLSSLLLSILLMLAMVIYATSVIIKGSAVTVFTAAWRYYFCHLYFRFTISITSILLQFLLLLPLALSPNTFNTIYDWTDYYCFLPHP